MSAPHADRVAEFDAFRPQVIRYCMCRGLQRADAEDVAQETLMRVTRFLPRYTDQGKPGAWVATIARRVLIERHRAAQSRIAAVPLVDVDPADAAPGPDERAVQSERLAQVGRCMGRLSALQQAVLRARLAGLSNAEAAVHLGVSQGSVRAAQFRAVRALREQLGVEE